MVADRHTLLRIRRGRGWQLGRRVAALEQRVAGLADELRTGRLVVVAPDGTERIVAEVVDGTAELMVGLADRAPRRAGVVLFASPATPATAAGTGLQVWAEGDQQAELAGWSHRDGWRTGLFLDRTSPGGGREPEPSTDELPAPGPDEAT